MSVTVTAINALFPWIKSWFDSREIQQKKQYELKTLQATAEIERARTGLVVESNYDTQALKQMQYSWKDEYILVLFSLPFIGSFIPKLQDHVAEGWIHVAKAPVWYQFVFTGIVMSVFGLRWYARRSNNEMQSKLMMRPDINL